MTPRRIGVFGGTFDPPHLGHQILACEAAYQLSLDALLWVLTPSPPHKENQTVTPVEHRLAMVQVAIQAESTFKLSRVDVDRPGPHYALDTLRLLRTAHPGDELIYLIGGDSLHDLPTWHRPREILDSCDALGVMRRPGDLIDLTHLEAVLPGASDRVRFIDAPLLEISSRQIRQRVKQGLPFRYYLLSRVYRYIQRNGLYRL